MTGRFAPTPSGRMHLGNIYAMLGAWLSSRARGERMILRIEDIDAPRVLPDADRWIMDDLAWLGMDWDGAPAYQSARLDRYEEALQFLREADVVYPCFCSRADIRAASAPHEGDGFVIYPGTCRRRWRSASTRSQEQSPTRADQRQHSLRLVVPDATVSFVDEVFGAQSFTLSRDLGDTVIRRSDGLFAYQLAVTVDDLDMGVTDIVRGRDLLRSTALQLHLRALLSASRAPSRCREVSHRDEALPASPAQVSSPSRWREVSRSDGGWSESPAQVSSPSRCREVPHRDEALPASPPALPPASPPALRLAHLPLIDNAAGRRLAKRERSLDMGVLRARGVSARQVIGYCAWLLRLVESPEPCEPRDLLPLFARTQWSALAASPCDRAVPDDPFGASPS